MVRVSDDKLIFRSSSFCSMGSCVEVALTDDGGVAVRDAKNPDTVLRFSREEWTAFRRGVVAGEFGPLE